MSGMETRQQTPLRCLPPTSAPGLPSVPCKAHWSDGSSGGQGHLHLVPPPPLALSVGWHLPEKTSLLMAKFNKESIIMSSDALLAPLTLPLLSRCLRGLTQPVITALGLQPSPW